MPIRLVLNPVTTRWSSGIVSLRKLPHACVRNKRNTTFLGSSILASSLSQVVLGANEAAQARTCRAICSVQQVEGAAAPASCKTWMLAFSETSGCRRSRAESWNRWHFVEVAVQQSPATFVCLFRALPASLISLRPDCACCTVTTISTSTSRSSSDPPSHYARFLYSCLLLQLLRSS